jgi:hypothetical protein
MPVTADKGQLPKTFRTKQAGNIVKLMLDDINIPGNRFGIGFWYGVVTGRGKSDFYAKVKPLTLKESGEQTLIDHDDYSTLYFPTESELGIVRSAFGEQIDAVVNGKPYPALDESCSYSFRSGVDSIPSTLRAERATKLEVAVKVRHGFDNYEQEAPGREYTDPHLHNFGFLNLVYLARLAGFDGLFEVGFKGEPVVQVKRLPIYGPIVNLKVLDMQEEITEVNVSGLAYKLDKAPKGD